MSLYIFFKKHLSFIFNIKFIHNICIGKTVSINDRWLSKTHKLDNLCTISLVGGDTACYLHASSCLFQTSLPSFISTTYYHWASKHTGKLALACAPRASLKELCSCCLNG